jgi:hypothetical protein
MSTKTLLYVGFSFTDDYLNEFRSEIVSMLRPNEQSIAHAVSATAQPTAATAAAMSGDEGISREEFVGRMRKIGAEREIQKGGLTHDPGGYSPEPSGGRSDADTDAAVTALDGRGGSQVTIAGGERSSGNGGDGGDGGETKDQTKDETNNQTRDESEDETQGGGSRPRMKSTTFMDMDDGVGVVARPVNTLAYVLPIGIISVLLYHHGTATSTSKYTRVVY